MLRARKKRIHNTSFVSDHAARGEVALLEKDEVAAVRVTEEVCDDLPIPESRPGTGHRFPDPSGS
jgi:hypothetical protein